MFDHRDPSLNQWRSDEKAVASTYPNIEIQIAICDRFNVKSNGRNCGNDLANLKREALAFTADT